MSICDIAFIITPFRRAARSMLRDPDYEPAAIKRRRAAAQTAATVEVAPDAPPTFEEFGKTFLELE